MLKFFRDLFAPKKPEEVAQSLFSGQYGESAVNPSPLVALKGYALFDEMRKDDQIRACLELKKNSILSTGWDIVSPDDEADDWEVSEFVRFALSKESLDSSFDQVLKEMLSAFEYGHSVTEKIYGSVADGDWAGKVSLRALKTRPAHSFDYIADEFGNLKTIRQRQDRGSRDLPRDKFVLYAYNAECGNHYGRSELDGGCYRSWWIKYNAYRWMSIFLERSATPPYIAFYNPDMIKRADQERLKTIMKSFQNGTYAIMPRRTPEELELWQPDVPDNITNLFIPAFDALNRDMSRSLLTPNLLGVTPDGQAGSYARAAVQFDLFLMVTEQIRCADIEERIVNEQIIKPLVDMNYNVSSYPRFKFRPIGKDNKIELLKTWGELVGKNTVVARNNDEMHIRKLLDFPIGEDGETLGEPIKKESAPPPPDMPPNDGEEPPIEDAQPVDENGKPKEFRARKPAEKAIDFQAITTALTAHEDKNVARLRDVFREIRDAVKVKVQRGYDADPIKLVQTFALPKTAMINAAVSDLIDGAHVLGQKHAKEEGKRRKNFVDAKKLPGVTPTAAVKYLKAKKLQVSGVLEDSVTAEVKQAILTGLKSGDASRAIIPRIEKVFEKYVGDDNKLQDGEPLSASRIETVVRTNTTEAYNQGRLNSFRGNSFVQAVMYSAIIDSRTTDVCDLLDGLYFKADDPNLDAITPPNHFNSVPASTRVTTKNGPRRIDSIKVGDSVLTHRGRYMPVTCVMGKRSDHPIVRELLLSTGRRLRITDEHPVLTTAGWTNAGNLKAGDVLIEHGKKMPGAVDMGVFRPDDCPSLFDEVAVPYSVSFSALNPALVAVDFQGNADIRPSEVDNVAIDGELGNGAMSSAGKQPDTNRLAGARHIAPRLGARISRALGGVADRIGVSLSHSLRVPLIRVARFFAQTVSPMRGAFGLMFPRAVSNAGLVDPIANGDTMALAPIGKDSFAKAERSLNSSDRFVSEPVTLANDVENGGAISQVDHSRFLGWSGAAIITIAEIDNKETLWNLAVSGDESYIADGVIVHNCRSVIVPVMIDETIEASEYATPEQIAEAKSLAKGFA